MSLFKQHSEQNEKQAKAALIQVFATVVGKHVVAQEFLNKTLSGGGKSQKNGTCLMCMVDRITQKMAKLESQAAQLENTYKMLFGERLNIEEITNDATKEFYPLIRARSKEEKMPFDPEGAAGEFEPRFRDVGSEGFPQNMPEGVRNMISTIRDAIRGKDNSHVDMHIVEMPSGKSMFFGVNPDDYNSAKGFYNAVLKARRTVIKNELMGGVNGEETIKEAVIQTAEEASKSPAKPPRGRKSGVDNKPKDPKLN